MFFQIDENNELISVVPVISNLLSADTIDHNGRPIAAPTFLTADLHDRNIHKKHPEGGTFRV